METALDSFHILAKDIQAALPYLFHLTDQDQLACHHHTPHLPLLITHLLHRHYFDFVIIPTFIIDS